MENLQTLIQSQDPNNPYRLSEYHLDLVSKAYRSALSESTRKIYLKHWTYFTNWCKSQKVFPLPAPPLTTAAYLTERALSVSLATIRNDAAAIRCYHHESGYPTPTDNPVVRIVMKGLAKDIGERQNRVDGIDKQKFLTIVDKAYNPKPREYPHQTLARASLDIALIALMRDALLRRSEAAAAIWGHITPLKDKTARLLIPRSKSDQTSEGFVCYLSAKTFDFLNTMVEHNRGGIYEPHESIFEIHDQQIANRIKAAALHAKIPGRYAGHSPRIGMAMDLAQAGTELPGMMQAARWQEEGTALRYIENISAGRNVVAAWYKTHFP